MPRRTASSKRWPHTEVPGTARSALDLLQEIVLEAVRRGAPNHDVLVRRALTCAGYGHGYVNESDHLELVRRARDHAAEARWGLAARMLEH